MKVVIAGPRPPHGSPRGRGRDREVVQILVRSLRVAPYFKGSLDTPSA